MAQTLPTPVCSNWNDRNGAKQWLERHYELDRPCRGSPMYQYLRNHRQSSLSCYLNDPEQDMMEQEFPEAGPWPVRSRNNPHRPLYPYRYIQAPPGPRPRSHLKTANRKWLEKSFPTKNQVLGSPLYQYMINEYSHPSKERGNIRLADHLSAGEVDRLEKNWFVSIDGGYQRGNERVVYYPDAEINSWKVVTKAYRIQKQSPAHVAAIEQQAPRKLRGRFGYKGFERPSSSGVHIQLSQHGGSVEQCNGYWR